MMKKISLVFLFFVICTGCSTHRTTVVLVPDPYGHVGEVTVQTEGGQNILSESGKAIIVKNKKTAPPPAILYDEQRIRPVFGGALDVEPPVPQKFILYFGSDSADLLPDSQNLIPEIVDSIRKRHSFDVSVNGHSDNVGSDEYNLELSLKRTTHIKDMLIKAGISETYINTASHGEGDPLVPTEEGVPEPRNRRVEIIVR